MIRLFTSYYIDKDPVRQKEIDECLNRNLSNPSIDRVFVVIENVQAYIALQDERVVKILIHERPTFDVMFQVMNNYTEKDTVNILANSDIFFDESIRGVEERIKHRHVFALTRWDNDNPEKEYRHIKRVDSQDAWIFRGMITPVAGDYCMGVCGCDNTLADRLSRAGYIVSNPSLTIKSYHLHNSGIRHYDINIKTPQPYKTLQYTT